MLIPVNWLRDYVSIDQPIAALADRLTLAGLEVEEIRETEGELVLDVKVTPNRGDWLSVLGIARETAAVTGASRHLPEVALQATGPTEPRLTVTIEADDLCPRYVARLIRGVRVGPSPEWMQRRLIAAGLRPINNVVDVTNYVMWEMGQPLHAFDYRTLREGRIVVRRARPGERIVTIDGTEVGLQADMLVIADAEKPVAIAGVMGGLDTEVSAETTDLLLESAYFDPVSVRRTSKRIPLVTAASYRFERHIDPEGTLHAADRAAALIAELAGGVVSETVVDCRPRLLEPRTVSLRPERCRAMLGMDVSDADMQRHLEALDLKVTPGTPVWQVTVPPFRADVTMEADLVEEVGRLAGYDRLPETLPRGETPQGRLSPLGRVTRRLRSQLLAQGLYEAVTHTLVNRSFLAQCRLEASPAWPAVDQRPTTNEHGPMTNNGGSPPGQEPGARSQEPVPVRNPISEEFNTLRPSLLPGLLAAVRTNVRRTEDLFFFEVGWVHSRPRAGGERDRLLAAGVMTGTRLSGSWNVDRERTTVDFYACKAVVEAIAAEFALQGVQYRRASHPAFHPGRAADVLLGQQHLGTIGELHPEVAGELELPRGVYLFELDAQGLLPQAERMPQYRAPSRFPAVLRDLAVVVDRSVQAEAVRAAVAEVDPQLVREARLFDVYTGKPVPEGKVSLTVALQLAAEDRTLTDAEADSVMSRARAELTRRFGAEFRG
jgi:phenylalanyl-tRNA synthetase beta chain